MSALSLLQTLINTQNQAFYFQAKTRKICTLPVNLHLYIILKQRKGSRWGEGGTRGKILSGIGVRGIGSRNILVEWGGDKREEEVMWILRVERWNGG